MFAQADAGTMVGLGSVCVTLLGLLGWVLREMVGQNKDAFRDASGFIKANTEVLVVLKTETEDGQKKLDALLTQVQDMKDLQDGRPCALIQRPDLVELFRQNHAPAVPKG